MGYSVVPKIGANYAHRLLSFPCTYGSKKWLYFQWETEISMPLIGEQFYSSYDGFAQSIKAFGGEC